MNNDIRNIKPQLRREEKGRKNKKRKRKQRKGALTNKPHGNNSDAKINSAISTDPVVFKEAE